jgi:hypothetical protein
MRNMYFYIGTRQANLALDTDERLFNQGKSRLAARSCTEREVRTMPDDAWTQTRGVRWLSTTKTPGFPGLPSL